MVQDTDTVTMEDQSENGGLSNGTNINDPQGHFCPFKFHHRRPD